MQLGQYDWSPMCSWASMTGFLCTGGVCRPFVVFTNHFNGGLTSDILKGQPIFPMKGCASDVLHC